jgi:hypothetical protein
MTGKLEISIDEKEKDEKVSTINISKESRMFAINPKGIAIICENIPKKPVKKPKNIVIGIKGSTIMFVIGATIERFPIL